MNKCIVFLRALLKLVSSNDPNNKVKMIQWKLQIATCATKLGQFKLMSEEQNQAMQIAHSINIDPAKIIPLCIVDSTAAKRKQAIDLVSVDDKSSLHVLLYEKQHTKRRSSIVDKTTLKEFRQACSIL